jgi:pyrophosphatase PpaX
MYITAFVKRYRRNIAYSEKSEICGCISTYMREYETYIFDLDNTLADSGRGLEKAYRAGFEAHGIPFDPSELHEFTTTPLDVIWKKFKPESPCKFRDFVSIIISTYDRCYADEIVAFPDTAECIKTLHSEGKKMAIVSYSMTEHIEAILEKLDLKDCFGPLIGADRCVPHKPEPHPVRMAMEMLGTHPEVSIMTGDGKNDVKSGTAAGTDTALISRTGEAVSASPTYVLSDLRELLTPFRRF